MYGLNQVRPGGEAQVRPGGEAKREGGGSRPSKEYSVSSPSFKTVLSEYLLSFAWRAIASHVAGTDHAHSSLNDLSLGLTHSHPKPLETAIRMGQSIKGGTTVDCPG